MLRLTWECTTAFSFFLGLPSICAHHPNKFQNLDSHRLVFGENGGLIPRTCCCLSLSSSDLFIPPTEIKDSDSHGIFCSVEGRESFQCHFLFVFFSLLFWHPLVTVTRHRWNQIQVCAAPLLSGVVCSLHLILVNRDWVHDASSVSFFSDRLILRLGCRSSCMCVCRNETDIRLPSFPSSLHVWNVICLTFSPVNLIIRLLISRSVCTRPHWSLIKARLLMPHIQVDRRLDPLSTHREGRPHLTVSSSDRKKICRDKISNIAWLTYIQVVQYLIFKSNVTQSCMLRVRKGMG